jgi:hypothetical protein
MNTGAIIFINHAAERVAGAHHASEILKKFDVSGYIGQKLRSVGRQTIFFPNFFYCTDSGQNKHVRSLMHKTAVNQ